MEHFWTRVNKTETCWLWTGAKSRGYGYFYSNKKNVQAYRVAYIDAKGEIPDGFHIDHLCRVPACVNPDHLEAVTPRENMIRGIPYRVYKPVTRKTVCNYGHSFDDENSYTYTLKNGKTHRLCKTCTLDRYKLDRKNKSAAKRAAKMANLGA